jgi:hypothetical protein
MASIFVSYAKEDLELVLPIVASLQEKGHTVWVDYKNILPGQDWKYEINNAIRDSDLKEDESLLTKKWGVLCPQTRSTSMLANCATLC